MDNETYTKQIGILQDFIRKQPRVITEFDEDLVRLLIGKITVYKEFFVVEFKSGARVVIVG